MTFSHACEQSYDALLLMNKASCRLRAASSLSRLDAGLTAGMACWAKGGDKAANEHRKKLIEQIEK